MIKKCIGCGAKLQSIDENKIGYIKEEKLKDGNYCERCYKMIHYNKITQITIPKEQSKIIKQVNNKNAFVFFLVDLFHLNQEMIDAYKQIKNPKCILVSKSDLIPNSFSFDKIKDWFKNVYNIEDEIHFISASKRKNIKKIFTILDENNINTCFIMGYTNVGKSTLINELKKEQDKINTSFSPNTTVDFISIFIDQYEIIDTPGFLLKEKIEEFNKLDFFKKLSPKKYIHPINYQMKQNESIVIEDKIRIVNLNEKNTFTLYMSNLLDTKKIYEKNDQLKDVESKIYHVDKNTDIVISGLGFINIKAECEIQIYIENHQLIEFRKSFLGSEYYEQNKSNE